MSDTWWLDELEREGAPRRMWVVNRNPFCKLVSLNQVNRDSVPSVDSASCSTGVIGRGMTAREALANAFGNGESEPSEESLGEAYDAGYDDGHDDGYSEGYDKGHDEGYDKGHAEAEDE